MKNAEPTKEGTTGKDETQKPQPVPPVGIYGFWLDGGEEKTVSELVDEHKRMRRRK